MRFNNSVFRRGCVPACGLGEVRLDPIALVKGAGDDQLGLGDIVFCGFQVPKHGFGLVFGNDRAAGVAFSEFELSKRLVRRCGPKPPLGFDRVFFDATALGVHHREVCLRLGVAFVRSLPKPE